MRQRQRHPLYDVWTMPAPETVAKLVDNSPAGMDAALERWGHRASRQALYRLLDEGRRILGRKAAPMFRIGEPAGHTLIRAGWDAPVSPAAALGLPSHVLRGA